MTDADSRPPTGPAPRVGAGRIDDELPYHDEAAPEAPTSFWDDDGGDGGDGEDTTFDDTPPPKRRGVESSLRSMIEWVAVAVGALAVALLIKAFLLQAFYIPS
ncbi:MAG: hypothetical protein AAGE98_17755, partial [Actinomycetota bacterium]